MLDQMEKELREALFLAHRTLKKVTIEFEDGKDQTGYILFTPEVRVSRTLNDLGLYPLNRSTIMGVSYVVKGEPRHYLWKQS